MSLTAFNYGANVIAFKKKGINYAMTCAWATQVDYDKIVCLMGSQSVSAKALEKGDIIGVSALSVGQDNIAYQIGDNHSDEVDKLKGVSYSCDESAILINDSSNVMKVKVIDILHLEGIEEDSLIYCKIIEYKENALPFFQFKK